MMEVMTALGLAGQAGLNAYLVLLIVGLAARFTNLITLPAPYDILTSTWVLVVVGVLLAIEIMADKIPVVDSINDMVGTVVRPTAGAILSLASTREIGLDPVLAGALGLIMAGGVHALKATARPAITASTGGLGNPFISFFEDLVAAGGAILTLLAPIVGLILILVVILLMAGMVVSVRRLLRRRKSVPGSP